MKLNYISTIYFSYPQGQSKTITKCEDEKALLKCPQYQIIDIKTVFWGRDDQVTCPNPPAGLTITKLCATTTNAKDKVFALCDTIQSCEVKANRIFLDDNGTCKKTYKYLKVRYDCIHSQINPTDVLKQGGKRRKRTSKE